MNSTGLLLPSCNAARSKTRHVSQEPAGHPTLSPKPLYLILRHLQETQSKREKRCSYSHSYANCPCENQRRTLLTLNSKWYLGPGSSSRVTTPG